jgi:hypothetical protein
MCTGPSCWPRHSPTSCEPSCSGDPVVTNGRRRKRKRGWLHRATRHGSEQYVAPDGAGPDARERERGSGGGGGGDEVEGAGGARDGGGAAVTTVPDTQASLDQVLRNAAEARDKSANKDKPG